MKYRHKRSNPGSARRGWAWCICAMMFACGGGAPARADEAGLAVLKSARWRAPAPERSRGQTSLMAMAAGGPIVVASSGTITALDRATGKTLWTTTRANTVMMAVGQTSILVAKVGNTSAEQRLLGLSIKDGSEAYEIPLPQEYAFHVPGSVHVVGKAVVLQSNQRYTLAGTNPPAGVARSGGGPPVLTAYDLETGKEMWKNNAAENTNVRFTFEPLIEVGTATGRNLLDPATGEVKWTYQPVTGGDFTPVTRSDMRSLDGQWYFLERPGAEAPAATGYQLVTRDAATGKVLGQAKLDYAAGTPAAATGQLLIMRAPRQSGTARAGIDVMRSVDLTDDQKKDRLTALEVKTGKAVWTTAVATDNPSTRVRVIGDVLLAGDTRTWPQSPFGICTMTGLDLATGKTLWSERFHSDMAVDKDLLVFALEDQWVGVSRREGKRLWSVPCDEFTPEGRMDYLPCEPMIADGVLYLVVVNGGDAAGTGIFAIPLEGNAALRGKEP